MNQYSESDLFQIIVNSAARIGLRIQRGSAEWLAEMACSEPRRANHLVATCSLVCAVQGNDLIDAEVVGSVVEKLGLTDEGLTAQEMAVLKFLEAFTAKTYVHHDGSQESAAQAVSRLLDRRQP